MNDLANFKRSLADKRVDHELEEVYITPSTFGDGLYNPLTYETVYITPSPLEFFKTGQITSWGGFEVSFATMTQFCHFLFYLFRLNL